jgi:hypothetical protein
MTGLFCAAVSGRNRRQPRTKYNVHVFNIYLCTLSQLNHLAGLHVKIILSARLHKLNEGVVSSLKDELFCLRGSFLDAFSIEPSLLILKMKHDYKIGSKFGGKSYGRFTSNGHLYPESISEHSHI